MSQSRRDFLKLTAAASALGASRATAAEALPAPASGTDDRSYWCRTATRIANPVLTALAQRQLKATMPVESR